jgi:hypothetical protein
MAYMQPLLRLLEMEVFLWWLLTVSALLAGVYVKVISSAFYIAPYSLPQYKMSLLFSWLLPGPSTLSQSFTLLHHESMGLQNQRPAYPRCSEDSLLECWDKCLTFFLYLYLFLKSNKYEMANNFFIYNGKISQYFFIELLWGLVNVEQCLEKNKL